MTLSKKCCPPPVGSTFSIFTNFQFIAINIHINSAIYKKVLPALSGEHNFDFREFSIHRNQHSHQFCDFRKCASRPRWEAHFWLSSSFKIRKIHANHNHVHFLRFWVTLGASWGRLVSILDRLGVNSGQICAKLVPTWTNMSPSWANLSQLDATLGPTCCQRGPSWVQLGYGKRRKSLFFHWFF